MKVTVDYDVCASTGACMQVCPEVFEVRSDGFLYVLVDEPPPELHDQVHEARRAVPDGCDHRGVVIAPPVAPSREGLPLRQQAAPPTIDLMGFHNRLHDSWARSGSLLCVGLDPDPARMPAPLDGAPDAIVAFCTAIVDATADLVCAFKPQIAHFASQRAEPALEAVCRYVREHHPDVVLVLDAKRGDIDSTSEHYAREAFGRYGADAVTVNPYLGTDAAAPFLASGGVLALCRTSNPGSAEVQLLDAGGEPVYLRVARMVADRWSTLGECGLVVGATHPAELADVRSAVGEMPILVPGVGAQGGALDEAVRAGVTTDGTGLIVSSSRAILYASVDDDFAEAARRAAMATRDAITSARTVAAAGTA